MFSTLGEDSTFTLDVGILPTKQFIIFRLLDIHELWVCDWRVTNLGKISVVYDLGIFSPNFQGLLAPLPPFPVVILNEMLVLSDLLGSTATPRDAEGAGGCQATKENPGPERIST